MIVLIQNTKGIKVHFQAALSALALGVSVLLMTGCGKSPPEVIANGETLQGVWSSAQSTVAVFRGIPFAAPPVGDLRWQAPQSHVARSGQVRAHEFAAACPQGSYMIDWYAEVAAAFGQGPEVVQGPNGESEDCLYLNIWTPSLSPETPLPVMVFVHGGSNRGGWSYEPNYLGEQLAARGVVVVSIAYRLGPLGFFSHPALQQDGTEVVANFGLLDIAAAFSWVREHIGSFGGAADNITGFGESAGAGNLIDLALARDPAAEPLFERIIAQSTGGSLSGRRSLDDEQQLGVRIADALNLPPGVSAGDLRRVPANEVLAAAGAALTGHYYDGVVDGKTLVQQPIAGLSGPQAARLDIMIGTNKHEWLMYLDETVGEKDLQEWILETAPEFSGSLRDVVSDEPEPRRALDRLITAQRMLCPSRLVAEKASAAGGEGLVYWFTRMRGGPGGEALGVYHGAELPYVFNQHDPWLMTEEADRLLTGSLMSYWVSYARNGSVRVADLPEWPMYTAARPWVMELGDGLGVVEPPDAWLCHYLAPRGV